MTTGIYQIRNKINKKIYIGSAINIARRWNEHIFRLGKQKHGNPHLQSVWDKYGQDNFEFTVLEECEKENLIEREQYYLDILKPKYNICRKAYSCLGVKRTEETRAKMSAARIGKPHMFLAKPYRLMSISKKGKKLSDETKKKLSIARRRRPGIPHTLESRKKISLSLMGRTGRKHSTETKMKISLGNKGKIMSSEAKEKISKANKGRVSPNKGKSMSLEQRNKISKANKGKKRSLEIRLKISVAMKKIRRKKFS